MAKAKSAPITKARLLKLTEALESRYGRAKQPQATEFIENLIAQILELGASERLARQGLDRIQAEYVDWNDMRVASVREIQDILGEKYPRSREKAEDLASLLADLYTAFRRMDLSEIAPTPIGMDTLRALPETTLIREDMVEQALLVCFRVHTFPCDHDQMNQLKFFDVVPEDMEFGDAKYAIQQELDGDEMLRLARGLREHVDFLQQQEEYDPQPISYGWTKKDPFTGADPIKLRKRKPQPKPYITLPPPEERKVDADSDEDDEAAEAAAADVAEASGIAIVDEAEAEAAGKQAEAVQQAGVSADDAPAEEPAPASDSTGADADKAQAEAPAGESDEAPAEQPTGDSPEAAPDAPSSSAKKKPAKKASSGTASVKKTSAEKSASTKKSASKKTSAKKTSAKKAGSTKRAATKDSNSATSSKKTSAKKTSAKKTSAKKSTSTKAAATKKTASKKAGAKKSASKKTAKKTTKKTSAKKSASKTDNSAS